MALVQSCFNPGSAGNLWNDKFEGPGRASGSLYPLLQFGTQHFQPMMKLNFAQCEYSIVDCKPLSSSMFFKYRRMFKTPTHKSTFFSLEMFCATLFEAFFLLICSNLENKSRELINAKTPQFRLIYFIEIHIEKTINGRFLLLNKI